MSLSLVSSDDAPSIVDALTTPDGEVFDLTQADLVFFEMRLAVDRRLKVNAAAVITGAAAGTVRYDWAAGDLDTPGEYEARWRIEWSDGTTQHTDPANSIIVAAQ